MKFFIVWEHYSNQWALLEKGYHFLEVDNPSHLDIELGDYFKRLAEARGTNKKFLVPVQCQLMPNSREDNEQLQVFEETSHELDPLLNEVVAFLVQKQRVSISGIQHNFRISYNRAARIIEQMEAQGIVSLPDHNGKREVL
ncbi:hypothetical protein GN242_07520 [Erwinia sorbitola]|uniref:FtsK gamma domain-containing protein n=1 Tax=Erwinia sorbitola TaxID=2681984 RepID=A0A6I6EKD2_9GAMM|nr:hypothetical protein GN242_07520 [Erwinia sorbitola]